MVRAAYTSHFAGQLFPSLDPTVVVVRSHIGALSGVQAADGPILPYTLDTASRHLMYELRNWLRIVFNRTQLRASALSTDDYGGDELSCVGRCGVWRVDLPYRLQAA